MRKIVVIIFDESPSGCGPLFGIWVILLIILTVADQVGKLLSQIHFQNLLDAVKSPEVIAITVVLLILSLVTRGPAAQKFIKGQRPIGRTAYSTTQAVIMMVGAFLLGALTLFLGVSIDLDIGLVFFLIMAIPAAVILILLRGKRSLR